MKNWERQEKDDIDSPSHSQTTTLTKITNEDKMSSNVVEDSESAFSINDQKPDIVGPFSDRGEKVPSKVMNAYEFQSAEQGESSASLIELVNSVADEHNSRNVKDRCRKVKFPGRRRLYKAMVNNTHKLINGTDVTGDILSNLRSRLEVLSIKKDSIDQLISSSDSFKNEKFIGQQPVNISEHVDADQKNKKDKNDANVASDQKLGQDSNDFTMEHTSSDESTVSSSGDEVSISLRNPRSNFSLPSKIANMLYTHQREGLKWLWSLHCKGKGGILGDDTGLGKTMQICSFLAGLFHSNLIKRVLVIVPKTLIPVWVKELGLVNLSGKTRIYSGTCAITRQYELKCILEDKGVLLTTYDIVCNNDNFLSGDQSEMGEDAVTWDYMILDEGHLIKNPKTQRAKSLLAIPCAHCIIISATPLPNNLRELWALYDLCCPDLLGDKTRFIREYERPILDGSYKIDSDRYMRISSAVAQDLRNRIQPRFLRRLKHEVFRVDVGTNTAKLSKKTELIVWLKLSSCQRQRYEAFLNSRNVHSDSPLLAIQIMQKICNHPLLLTKRAAKDILEGMESVLNQEDGWFANKYDIGESHEIISCKISFIMSLLDNLIPQGHNFLIFSHSLQMLNHVQDALNGRGYRFLRLDGTTKASDRKKIVDDFQNGIGAPVFLLSSRVGGVGLTLTKADRVIVVDPAWNASTDNQSVDRAYRIGQQKDVVVYRLITCGTVEKHAYRKQIHKEGLFKTATDNKDHTRYFSKKDLEEVFSLPKLGFDASQTQQQLHKEHDCEHKMDPYLEAHMKFLESLGIAGISHHSLLFSKTAPVPVLRDEELTRIRRSRYMGSSSWRSLHERIDQFAFNPKEDAARIRKNLSPNIFNKLKESEVKQVNCQPQVYANKRVMSGLRKHFAELGSELRKLRMFKKR